MNKIRLISFLFIVFLAFSCNSNKSNNSKINLVDEKKRIEFILNKINTALEKENINDFSACIKQDSSVFCFGTSKTEVLNGWKQFRNMIVRQFEVTDSLRVSHSKYTINFSDDAKIAWVSTVFDMKFKCKSLHFTYPSVRFTGVLCKNDTLWQLVQAHYSVAADIQTIPDEVNDSIHPKDTITPIKKMVITTPSFISK